MTSIRLKFFLFILQKPKDLTAPISICWQWIVGLNAVSTSTIFCERQASFNRDLENAGRPKEQQNHQALTSIQALPVGEGYLYNFESDLGNQYHGCQLTWNQLQNIYRYHTGSSFTSVHSEITVFIVIWAWCLLSPPSCPCIWGDKPSVIYVFQILSLILTYIIMKGTTKG